MNFEEIKFVIVSYHRSNKQTTLSLLEKYGIDKSQIYIQTQCEEDFTEYKKNYGERCNILYKEGHNVAENRSNAISNFEEGDYILMLDDDLTPLYLLDDETKHKSHKINGDEFKKIIIDMCNFLNDRKAHMVSISNSSNPLNQKFQISEGLCPGYFMLFVKNKYDFNRRFFCYEDLDFQLQAYADGKKTYLFKFIRSEKAAMQGQEGGCHDMYMSGRKKECFLELCDKYKKYIQATWSNDYSGTRITLKRKKKKWTE